jgi:diguanylate cyclase (GGDEF)-like protein/PAS domain S-box-containing protein
MPLTTSAQQNTLLASSAANADAASELVRLQQINIWYEQALAFANIGIYRWESVTDKWFWSDQVYEIRGFPRDEMLANPVDFYAQVHPEDRERLLVAEIACKNGLAPMDIEYRYVRPDGSLRWHRERADRVMLPDGSGEALYGALMDITEQKHAELELSRHRDQLEALAITDGLTALANRRQFDLVFAREWSRSLRQGRSLALVLLDVDYFKSYNDTYGHLAGDACLKLIADVLNSLVRRATDLAARYGGEEFVVVASEMDLDAAVQFADAIRAAVQDLKQAHTASPYGVVTVSVGVAVTTPSAQAHPEQFLLAADKALYQAKHLGRNQVHAVCF